VEGARVDLASVQTNIVNIEVVPQAAEVAREALALGVVVHPSGPHRLRLVTHLDVTAEQVEAAADALARAMGLALNRAGVAGHV
jgi:threonine aldolase